MLDLPAATAAAALLLLLATVAALAATSVAWEKRVSWNQLRGEVVI